MAWCHQEGTDYECEDILPVPRVKRPGRQVIKHRREPSDEHRGDIWLSGSWHIVSDLHNFLKICTPPLDIILAEAFLDTMTIEGEQIKRIGKVADEADKTDNIEDLLWAEPIDIVDDDD